MNVDTVSNSNAAICGSPTADGAVGLSRRTELGPSTAWVATAYRACDGLNWPLSSVLSAEVVKPTVPAERIDTSSNTALLAGSEPSTSKNVTYDRANGDMSVVVPDRTNLKSYSAALSVVGVPSAHLAVAASREAPDAHDDVSTSWPRQKYPDDKSVAWDWPLAVLG